LYYAAAFFFYSCCVAPRPCPSFPTRRSSDLGREAGGDGVSTTDQQPDALLRVAVVGAGVMGRYHATNYATLPRVRIVATRSSASDRKSTRLNSSHVKISYAVFCLKKKRKAYR